MTSERDHIVNLNEDLSLRIVEFEFSVKEMNSQMESLQVRRFLLLSKKYIFANPSIFFSENFHIGLVVIPYSVKNKNHLKNSLQNHN